MEQIDFYLTEQQLFNWGSWARSDWPTLRSCGSAEKWYRRERQEEREVKQRKVLFSQTLGPADAERVDRALVLVRRPLRQFALLHFYQRRFWRKICRRPRMFDAYLQSTVEAVHAHLDDNIEARLIFGNHAHLT